MAENTKRVRALVTYEVMESYFKELEKTLKYIPSTNIVTYDETNFADDPGAVKVLLKREIKHKTCNTI